MTHTYQHQISPEFLQLRAQFEADLEQVRADRRQLEAEIDKTQSRTSRAIDRRTKRGIGVADGRDGMEQMRRHFSIEHNQQQRLTELINREDHLVRGFIRQASENFSVDYFYWQKRRLS